MSSLSKWFALIGLLWLTGCGFRPVYGAHNGDDGVSKLSAGIQVDSIPGRDGQLLKNDLEDLLNPESSGGGKAIYHLHTTLTNTTSPIGVSRDGTVSRYNVYLNSQYTVTRIADNKVMLSGNLTHVSSYSNAINAYFSTYISDQDAIKRGVAELAELYRNRLAAWLDAGAPEQASPSPTPTGVNPIASPTALNPLPQSWQTGTPPPLSLP